MNEEVILPSANALAITHGLPDERVVTVKTREYSKFLEYRGAVQHQS